MGLIEQVRGSLIKAKVNCSVEEKDGNIVCKELKPDIIFVNSEDEGFVKGDMVWWFCKYDFSIYSVNINNVLEDECASDDYNSEIYKSEETAYQKCVEYAHSRGESIEFAHKNNTQEYYINAITPTWDWYVLNYRIKPATNYRPFRLEEAEDYLGLKVKRKEGNNRKLVDNVDNQDELDSYFEYYTKLDGTVVGKEIR